MPAEAALLGLPAQTSVARRIESALPEMSTAQRQFAELVRSAPLKVARLSIHEAVALSGVSVATANRFATKLGFDGYADFKAELIRSFEELFAPYERFEREISGHDSPEGLLRASLAATKATLDRTAAGLSGAELEKAVAMISGAERIYIAGFDLAACLGGIFAIELSMLGCKARAAADGGGMIGAIREIFDFTERDLVIAIAFKHYYTDTLRVARFAREAGYPVLAITDTAGSPLLPLSDVALFVPPESDGTMPSSAAILGLIEGLKAAVAGQIPEGTETGRRFAEAAYPWMTAGPKGWDFKD